jgi:hypothetical protein
MMKVIESQPSLVTSEWSIPLGSSDLNEKGQNPGQQKTKP